VISKIEESPVNLLQLDGSLLGELIRDSPLAIIVSTRDDGQILDVNEGFLRLFGYSRGEVIGETSTALGLWSDSEQRSRLVAALTAAHPVRNFPTTMRTKSGADLDVLATVSEADVDGQACLLSQLYDVSPYQQTEIRFRRLIEQLPVAVYSHALGDLHAINYISPQITRLLGYTPAEVLAAQPSFLTDRIHPEDQARVRDAIERARSTAQPFRAEYRIRARDGRWVWLEDEAAPVYDARGRPLLWQGVLVDITERRRAEAAEARYATLFQHGLDAVLVTDPHGRILDANPAACRMFDRSVEDLRQVGRQGIVERDDPRLATALIEQARDGHFHGELTMLRGNGQQFPAEVATQVFPEPDGQAWISLTIRDLTTQREAEAALRAGEERFRALVQNSYDIIVVLDAEGKRSYISPSTEELLGYAADELVGRSPLELIHPDDVPNLQRAVAACVAGATEVLVFDLRFRHRDGGWRDFEAIGTNLLDEPSVEGIVFNSRDVTARRAAQVALRVSENRLAQAQEIACLGSWEWDIASDVVTWSDQLFRNFGLVPQSIPLSYREFLSRIHPDDRDRIESTFERALVTGESYSFENRVVWPDGRVRTLYSRGETVLDGDGRPVKIRGTSQDITERVQAEQALRESEERFHAAFDHAPIGMAVLAPDGQFLLVNCALSALLGYSEQDLLQMTVQAVSHPDDVARQDAEAKRMWTGEIDDYQLEQRYLHRDGHEMWVLVTASALRDGSRPRYAIAQIEDITDRRHLEIERAMLLANERQYAARLGALAEMRADLTAMIAHELRAPVSALRMTTFLLTTGELSPPDQAAMFATLEKELEQLDRLITDVARVTEAENEDFSIQQETISVPSLLERAESFARSVLSRHPFTMTAAPEVNVICDPERIGQVLRNLLANVATHTPAGTPVELRAKQIGQRVRIEVADRGPGLSDEDLATIFEKFGRGRQAAARQTPGAGLGLYVSRKIVRAHDSDLKVVSRAEVGTTFSFELDVAP
jgi:PAS domain S-box-containing protein